MSSILIKNGLVLDPSQGLEKKCDILVEDGKIKAIATVIETDCEQIIDANNKWVVPGFVELHAHFREPGFEGKETIATGSQAALQGGYTTVCVMPNTKPTIDSELLVRYLKYRAQDVNKIKLEVIGAVSKGLQGEQLAEMGKMVEAGAIAFSDDGMPIMDAQLMRNALEYGNMFNKPIVVHEEDVNLSKPGVMHEGLVSTKFGLAGIPAAAEEVMIARDIILAELTGAHVHVAHVSTAKAVELIRLAKARGIRITCEVTPHHLLLSEDLLVHNPYDTNAKMSPPLRTAADCAGCLAGLLDGTINAIATDHAPHKQDEKDVEFEYAPNGITGLETAFAALYTGLVLSGKISRSTLIAKLTSEPARIFGLDRGSLLIGKDADITIIDPTATWQVSSETLASKGKNTPWLGQTLTGRVDRVLVNGQIKYTRGQVS